MFFTTFNQPFWIFNSIFHLNAKLLKKLSPKVCDYFKKQKNVTPKHPTAPLTLGPLPTQTKPLLRQAAFVVGLVFQPPKSDLCSLPYPRSIQLFSLVDRAPRETKQEFFSFFLLFISQLFLNRFASFKRQTTLKITPEIIRLFKKNKPRFRRGQPRFRPRLTLMLFFLSSLNFSAVSEPIFLI